MIARPPFLFGGPHTDVVSSGKRMISVTSGGRSVISCTTLYSSGFYRAALVGVLGAASACESGICSA